MRFGHRASDRGVTRLVRSHQAQRAQSAEQANVEDDQNQRDAPEWNLKVAFFGGARTDWSCGIQAVESSIEGWFSVAAAGGPFELEMRLGNSGTARVDLNLNPHP